MAKVNNILKDNYELKAELSSMVELVKENEIKYQGFKIVILSFLLSDDILEFSDKSLKYLEDIFNIDKAVLYFKDGVFDIVDEVKESLPERFGLCDDEAIKFSFFEHTIYSSFMPYKLHKAFALEEDNYSYIIAPIIDNGKIVASLALYSYDKSRFKDEKYFDFINELTIFILIAIKNLNNIYLLKGKE